ncbi:NERD domain-containing protein [Streptomyces sp. NBC_00820]|nr:NERD domain-containing protein [Streptomyces sp. NBC_00820]
MRGPDVPAKALDARALAALAANPGCHRRAILDGAGVDKAALASALGAPSAFGQSQFALTRGNAFEARVKADGGAELLRLAHSRLDPGAEPPASAAAVPDLGAPGPEGRTARTALALREAVDSGGWTLLDHPMLALDVAGSPAFLEPDAVVVHPDGVWTVVEIKSFPMLDGAADPAKVGAAARQAAVYVLALEQVAARLDPAPQVRHQVLLVCPKDFSNLATASVVDVRKQRAVTARQLARLTRVEEIADDLPEGVCFAPDRPAEELTAAVGAVPAAYAPECLSACELAFHCRERSRAADAVTRLGRPLRAELGGLTTVTDVLAAARGESGDPDDPAVAALRRAAALRAEALRVVAPRTEAPGEALPCP